MAVEKYTYGTTQNGEEVNGYTITNANGVAVRCIEYGCRLTHLFVPSARGTEDVLLGYDTLAGYEADTSYQGAFIGRYGNRIGGASFTLNDEDYHLPANDNGNYLHGTLCNRVFQSEVAGDNSVSFTYTSPDGDDGFPGEVWVGLLYTLTDKNELMIDYRATSSKDTHLNLTNHSYFNLAGPESDSIEDHMLWLGCSHFTEVDNTLLPTGRLPEVKGGALDFTTEKRIGRDIGANDPQLVLAGGYDHNFIIDKRRPGQLAATAILRDEGSGRTMRVYTTQPGVQFYSGNFLGGEAGKGGRPLSRRRALCLETQHFPDSPHHPDFPSTLVRAGEKHHQITVYQFEW